MQGITCGGLYRNVIQKALGLAPANKTGILAIGESSGMTHTMWRAWSWGSYVQQSAWEVKVVSIRYSAMRAYVIEFSSHSPCW